MDIHKPKAAHSWREFAVEIGTIIVGILIALSLEQAVEWAHGQREVAETRETLHSELARDLGVLEFIGLQDACLDARVNLLEAWADGRAQLSPRGLTSMENRPLMPVIRFTAWDVAKTGAVAAHMPVADRLRYADVYERLGTASAILQSERDAWRELGRFSGADRLDAEQARRLKEDLGMIRSGEASRRFNMIDHEQHIRALGVKPSLPKFPPGRTARDLCGPVK